MVLLNLLREVQYKRENVILVGLTPSPKGPCEFLYHSTSL